MKIKDRSVKVRNYVKKSFPSLDLTSFNVDSFLVEVYSSPFLLAKVFDIEPVQFKSELDAIRRVNVLGWIYFKSLDNSIDGHNCDNTLINESEDLYSLELSRFGISFLNIKEDFLLSSIFPVTEEKIIRRNRIYYLPFIKTFNIESSQVEAIDCYLIAKQYIDDLKDFSEDIHNFVPTLLTTKFDISSMRANCSLYTETFTRVGNLLSKSEMYLRTYLPFRRFHKNFKVSLFVWKLYTLVNNIPTPSAQPY